MCSGESRVTGEIDLNYPGKTPQPEISVIKCLPDNEPLSETLVSRATASIHPSEAQNQATPPLQGFQQRASR